MIEVLDVEPRHARKAAILSENLQHRYALTRTWRLSPPMPADLLAFVMLNPSTADDEKDDQTIRRCMMIGWREGYDGIEVCNLRSFRARDPKRCMEQPRSPVNWMHLETIVTSARNRKPIICAWGASKFVADDAKRFTDLAATGGAELKCLGRTKDGSPRHPCYIANNQDLEPFP